MMGATEEEIAEDENQQEEAGDQICTFSCFYSIRLTGTSKYFRRISQLFEKFDVLNSQQLTLGNLPLDENKTAGFRSLLNCYFCILFGMKIHVK